MSNFEMTPEEFEEWKKMELEDVEGEEVKDEDT